MHHHLSIQLKSHRKRSGFSQEELAFLLGLKVASAISRYEHGEREPDVRTAFAYQIVFQSLAHQLLPDIFADVCRDVTERARTLAETLRHGVEDAKTAYKLQQLTALIGGSPEDNLNV